MEEKFVSSTQLDFSWIYCWCSSLLFKVFVFLQLLAINWSHSFCKVFCWVMKKRTFQGECLCMAYMNLLAVLRLTNCLFKNNLNSLFLRFHQWTTTEKLRKKNQTLRNICVQTMIIVWYFLFTCNVLLDRLDRSYINKYLWNSLRLMWVSLIEMSSFKLVLSKVFLWLNTPKLIISEIVRL